MPNEELGDGDDRVRRLVAGGAEIAGGAVGGALGFLAAGPAGAAALGAAGVLAARTLNHIGTEICNRVLGPRESVRVGGVLAIAADRIRRRLEEGASLRSDGFFEPRPDGRSDAEEVAEAVLLKSQREPEERKLPYVANLLANVGFQSDISSEMAHQLTKAAEDLTYRQLCILRLAVVKHVLGLRAEDYRGQTDFPKELYQILYECLDLYHRGFVHFGGEVALGLTDVKSGSITVQGLGADLYNLMQLWTIPDEHIQKVAEQLRSVSPTA